MKNILFLLAFCLSSFAVAQELPPPPLKPSNENKILISKLIKLTDVENYFYSYCKNKVEQVAQEDNWNIEKKEEIINSIEFKSFEFMAYNAFASNSKQDLEDLIKVFEKINYNKPDMLKLIPINQMTQLNFDEYIKNLIDGKFILE